jgi:cation transport regulator ChaC
MNGLDTSCAISIAMVAPEAQSRGAQSVIQGRETGMADLKVEFDLLESAEQTMTSLTSEFKNIKAQASDYDGAMGSGDIAGAMGSFSGNWDYHRDKLTGSMQALGQMITESKKQFHETDNKLAANLKTKTEKK